MPLSGEGDRRDTKMTVTGPRYTGDSRLCPERRKKTEANLSLKSSVVRGPSHILFISDITPNLALMKLAQEEVNQGNKVFTKHPNPHKIYCSWVFKKSVNNQTRLDTFKNVDIQEGGFYVDPSKRLPTNIEHLMPYYPLYENGETIPRMGYTSRGCNNNCPWCIVTKKEGRLRDAARIEEFWDAKDKRLFLLDNDFLNSPRYKENMDFLIEHQIKVNFHQGLQIRGITQRQAADLSVVNSYLSNFKDLGAFFAWDNIKDESKVLEGIELLRQYWPKRYINFYVLGGFPNGDEFKDVYYRCKVLTDKGIRPFVMPYNTANKKIRGLKRCISLGTWKKLGLDRAWKEYTYRGD